MFRPKAAGNVGDRAEGTSGKPIAVLRAARELSRFEHPRRVFQDDDSQREFRDPRLTWNPTEPLAQNPCSFLTWIWLHHFNTDGFDDDSNLPSVNLTSQN